MNRALILPELAERCEAATGPDRKLDKDLACALQDAEQARTGKCPPLRWSYFTASIDAALTLVPEGMDRQVAFFYGNVARAWLSSGVGPVVEGNAKTEALAICAAALRARAAQ